MKSPKNFLGVKETDSLNETFGCFVCERQVQNILRLNSVPTYHFDVSAKQDGAFARPGSRDCNDVPVNRINALLLVCVERMNQ